MAPLLFKATQVGKDIALVQIINMVSLRKTRNPPLVMTIVESAQDSAEGLGNVIPWQ